MTIEVHNGVDFGSADPIRVGNVPVAAVYAPDGTNTQVLRYQNDNDPLTMNTETDLNLKTWLDGQTVTNPNKPVIINFTAGERIGAVNNFQALYIPASIETAYPGGVTLNVNGGIRGRRGGDAVRSEVNIDIINAGQIRGSIDSGLDDAADSLVNIIISSTGDVSAGGGNGGNGGKGGNGDTIANVTSYRGGWNTGGTDYWRCPVNGDLDWLIIRWGGSNVVDQRTGWNRNYKYKYQSGGYSYLRGTYGVVNENSGAGDNDWWNVARGNYYTGTGGAGGAGGNGIGYNQTRTNGASGASGTNRSGSGGKGGNGGDWGQNGGNGAQGGSGLYYSYTSSSNVRSGTGGTAGTAAGKAFVFLGSAARLFGINSPQARALNL